MKKKKKKKKRNTKRKPKADRKVERAAVQQSECINQLFGYSKSHEHGNPFLDSDSDDIVCMARLVESIDVVELKRDHGIDCTVGQWVVSTGGCGNITIHGPFVSMEEAMSHGVDKLGVMSWVSPPTFYDMP